MSEKQRFVIRAAGRVRAVMTQVYHMLISMNFGDGEGVELILKPIRTTRSLEQNAKLWAMLGDVARQKQWVVDGALRYLEPEEWKDIFTAALAQEMRVAQGINGGVVLLGRRTSKMTVRQMADLIEVIQAFGAEHGIRWSASDKSLPEYWREAA